jgi:type I restriction enzyme S subunit
VRTSEGKRLVPRLRFPEFIHEAPWQQSAGSDLFAQVNERNAQADLPVLAITQEHGATSTYLIDDHVSVTDLKTERFIRAHTRNLESLRDGKMISYKRFSAL